jgi:hypothetical protein
LADYRASEEGTLRKDRKESRSFEDDCAIDEIVISTEFKFISEIIAQRLNAREIPR